VSNSLTDLNQYANTSVIYTDNRAYSITFSANAASNTSTTIGEDQSFVVPAGINIASVISQPGNITYNVMAGTAGNVVGTWPTLPIGISNVSSGNVFSIRGTFDNVTWTAVKGLTLTYPDKETNFSFTANLVYPNTANVSLNNTWSWTNAVTVANTNPDLTLTTSYNWAEDISTTFVYSVDDLDPTATYTLTFDQFSGTNGVISVNGTSPGVGNTATVTGNRAAVNSAAVVFNPYPDATDNVQVYVSAVKSNPFGNVTFASNVVANLTCNSTHSDYSLTTAYNYAEDATTPMVFSILDTDPTATSFTVKFDQTSGNTGAFFVNGVSQGVGNLTFSNSKANINAANVSFLTPPDYTGNVGLTYSQIKSKPFFGNVTTVDNVAITMTCTSTHADYSLTTAYNFAEDAATDLVFDILDTDVRATGYTVGFAQTSGTPGLFFVNGINQGIGNSAIFSNSKANINSANVSFVPYPDATANVGLAYTQVKTNSVFGNVTQVLNEPITLTCTSTHSDYNLTTAYNYTEDGNVQLAYEITDPNQTGNVYHVRFDQVTGNTGVFFVNNTSQGIGNPAIISGTQANVNSANVNFLPAADVTSDLTLTYNQIKTTPLFGNVIQAGNINLNLTCTNAHAEYSFAAMTYIEDTDLDIFPGNQSVVLDTDTNATSYTVSYQQVSGDPGTWRVTTPEDSNVVVTSNSYTTYSRTGTRTQINQVSGPGTTKLEFLPAVDSVANVTIRYNQSKVNSIFGNVAQAVNVDAVFSVSGTNPEISNMIGVTRAYTGNTVNSIFSVTTPYINDGTDIGQTYTISLNSALGKFGNSAANALLANTYSFIGNITQVNNQLSLMKFVPAKGTSSSGTFTYTQARGNVSQVNANVTLTGSAGPAISSQYTFTSNSTWTPTFEEAYYSGNAQVFAVGGGGGGSRYISGPAGLENGFGGAGGSVVLANVTFTSATANVTVGAGGLENTTGGNSSITQGANVLATANGGYGNLAVLGDDRWDVSTFNVTSPAGSFGWFEPVLPYVTPPESTSAKSMYGGAPGANGTGNNAVTGTSGSTNTFGVAGNGYLRNGIYYGAGGRSVSFYYPTGNLPPVGQLTQAQGTAGLGAQGTATAGPGAGGNAGSYLSTGLQTFSPGTAGILTITIS